MCKFVKFMLTTDDVDKIKNNLNQIKSTIKRWIGLNDADKHLNSNL